MSNVHDFTVSAADGTPLSLRDYAGKALLIVNVASRCGLTPQYEGLQELQHDLGPEGLQVLGFPCNQFGGQEPGTAEEIAEFCSVNYDVSFPVLAKIDVNGPDADPLYRYLRSETGGADIEWNFTKFLVDGNGEIVRRFGSRIAPADLRADVESALAGQTAGGLS
jgi:glutathione peroxidase